MPFERGNLAKTIPLLILGLLAFILYIIYFVDIQEMAEIFRQVDLFIYLISLGSNVLEMIFFALAWQYFLNSLSVKIGFKKTFIYSWISNFVDLLVPAESLSGEVTRIFLISREGIDAGKATASVVIQRILGMVLIIVGLLIGIIPLVIGNFFLNSLVQYLIILVMTAATLFLLIIVIICLRENWTRGIVNRLFMLLEIIGGRKWKIQEWREKAFREVTAFHESIKIFGKRQTDLLLPIGFSLLAWLFGISVYYIVFLAIGQKCLDWPVLFTVYSLVIAIKSIPVGVPAEVGVTEVAMTTLFGVFNVPLHISAAATVLIRINTVWFRFLAGFIATQWLGIKTVTGRKG
ncbi:MAG: lysylphosphatidylglycerol synthase transmembrane domain-containing protein [Nitrososphaerota archaeon]|nr:flippase-like domain-containing protein [Candidatus Bathyarchaeota archaeon]MDW8049241.1 lysylphosphatidylglycerol synthase transmembrane domain-containing protein [Nitrososphaerota archaeon]